MGRRTMAGKMNQGVFFLVCFFFSSAVANIAEYDEYWRRRASEAKKHFEKAYHPHPFNVTNEFNLQTHLTMSEVKKTRRTLRDNLKKKRDNLHNDEGPCQYTNPIDACWRCQANWRDNRKRLADCAMGFARGTTGGKDGDFYVVSDDSDNDLLNPKLGTLRHAVIQEEPLWIIFDRPMQITLKQELMVSSDKTIDGRGHNIHITEGGGITLQYVKNVIIHGLHVHDIYSKPGGMIRDSATHFGFRTQSDGDAISIFGASGIWIDHCSLSRSDDGLVDVIQGSTAITLSNNHLTHHNDVFLFGAKDDYTEDKKMQITVAFNHFGKGLVQRMPRCRFGFFHVVNNDYTHWIMYAIGGSLGPTIVSQGNRFIAPNSQRSKEVTKRVDVDIKQDGEWQSWTWISNEDVFINDAFFRVSGATRIKDERKNFLIPPRTGKDVSEMTKFSGPRKCRHGKPC